MAWVSLITAGLFEIVWAAAMKQSHGFTRLLPTCLMLAAMAASLALLAAAMRTLPLGTAYLVWTGIGAVGAFAVGALAFGEPVSGLRLIAAGLIVAGVAAMKFGGGA